MLLAPAGQGVAGVEDVGLPGVTVGDGSQGLRQGLLAVVGESNVGREVRHQFSWEGSRA